MAIVSLLLLPLFAIVQAFTFTSYSTARHPDPAGALTTMVALLAFSLALSLFVVIGSAVQLRRARVPWMFAALVIAIVSALLACAAAAQGIVTVVGDLAG